MVAFLMLGIIPGTNIQISFENWLMFMCLLIFVGLLALANKKRLPLVIMVTVAIRHSTRTATPMARLA